MDVGAGRAAAEPTGFVARVIEIWALLGGFLAINLIGAKLSGGVELGVVATKLAILALFAAVGIGIYIMTDT